MIIKHKYLTFAVLIGVTLLVGALLPLYFNAQRGLPEPGDVDQNNQVSSPVTPQAPPVVADLDDLQNRQDTIQSLAADSNCTYPSLYWQEQPAAWPAQVVLGGQVYSKEQIGLFYAAPQPDVQTRLIQQIHTTFMNVINGADILAIESALQDAVDWLEINPAGAELSDFTRQQGLYLIQTLLLYNTGDFGPGMCEDGKHYLAMLPTPLPTNTALPPTPEPQIVQVRPAQPTQAPDTGRDSQPEPLPSSPIEPQPAPTDVPPTPSDVPPTPTEAPLPSATPFPPPPPPAPAPTSCEDNLDNQKAQEIADEYGASYSEVNSWFCQGFSPGEVEKGYDLARETGASIFRVMELRLSGMGWGEIKKELNP